MKRNICILLLILLISYYQILNISYAQGAEMKGKGNRINQLLFVPQHSLLVGICASAPQGSVRFWSSDGRLKDVLELGEKEWANAIAVSNDGNLLAVTFLVGNKIGCYSTREKRWLWQVKWVGRSIVGSKVRFSPDDRQIVVVDKENIVTYDAQSGSVIQKTYNKLAFSGGLPNYRTRLAALSPSTRYAAMWQGSLEHDEGLWIPENIWVSLWDIEKRQTIAKQEKIQSPYKNCSAVFTLDEKNVILGSMDGYIRVWSVADQKVIREWRAFKNEFEVPFREYSMPNIINALTFSFDGRYLASLGSEVKTGFAIKIWDFPTNKLLREFDHVAVSGIATCWGYPMAFSPDGKYFAFEKVGNLCLYDTKTWQEEWCVDSLPDDKTK